jgi:hypothetical protein
MNNAKVFGGLVLVFLFVMSFASAIPTGMTLIAGKIYNSDYTAEIAGANVVVTCVSGETTTALNTTSLSDGAYSVTFSDDVCNFEDELTVYAEKDGQTGTKTGIIHKDMIGSWDVGVVNVPLVPEFGLIVGLATIFGAVGIFFFVRKK